MIVDNKCIVQSIWRETQCALVKKILVLLTYFFFVRSFYGTNSTSSRYTGLRYVPLPEGNVSSDSDQESDEEYIPPDNVSDQESESDNNDVPSETEEEVMETDGDDDNDFAPITWQPRGSAWRMPAEASQIEKRDIKLKPEFADKITRQTEAFEILSMLFATDDYWKLVHRPTLLYITWCDMSTNKWKKVKKPTMQELKIFHGIIIYMGILRLPSRRMYWQKGTCVDQIANAMAFHRFIDISQMIHYNDNNAIPARGLPNYNPCYKIQPLIDFFRERYSEVVYKETFLSVDGLAVPFKGHNLLRRYLKNKPKKWGYKLWALAGISGYVYDFEVDGMKGSHGPALGDKPTCCHWGEWVCCLAFGKHT